MSLGARADCFSGESNGLIEVLHFPKLLVPSGEINCKIIQGHQAIRVSLWTKVEGFSVEDNGLIEVLHCPKLLVPSGETN